MISILINGLIFLQLKKTFVELELIIILCKVQEQLNWTYKSLSTFLYQIF